MWQLCILFSAILKHRDQLPLVVGLQDYSSDSEENLCFKAGDHVFIINTDGEKWFGYHKETGRTGYLPRIFVREKLERKRYSFSWINFQNMRENEFTAKTEMFF